MAACKRCGRTLLAIGFRGKSWATLLPFEAVVIEDGRAHTYDFDVEYLFRTPPKPYKTMFHCSGIGGPLALEVCDSYWVLSGLENLKPHRGARLKYKPRCPFHAAYDFDEDPQEIHKLSPAGRSE